MSCLCYVYSILICICGPKFVVYSGYYYVLTLIFAAAGVYKLTSEGWLHSVRVCCAESVLVRQPPPPPAAVQIQAQDEDTISQDSRDKLI